MPDPVEWRPLSGRLAAHVAGPDDGPCMVFAHGFTQTSTSWMPIAAEFVRSGHRCVLVDLPGHGHSAGVRADLRLMADMIASVSAPGTFVGYSLGGRAMLHVALMYPHLVQRLAVIGANPGIADEAERAQRRDNDEHLARRVETIGVEAFLAEWMAQPLFGELQASADDVADRRRNTAEGLAGSLRMAGTGSQGSLWARLRELNMPVLAVAGELDTKFVAIARQLAEAVPYGTFAAIPGAAHAAHLQQPAAVIDVLRAWLSG
ncbi:MAG: hypothetical protein RLZ14_1935 [Actinomycetota bacterium]